MSLTQAAGRININTKRGLNTKVNSLDQNSYLLPDIDLCHINMARHSYMGTEEVIELNYFGGVIDTLSDIEF